MIDSAVSVPMIQRASVNRRTLKDRRPNHDRRRQVGIAVLEESADKTNISAIIQIAVSLIMILIAVKICIFTGLLNPLDPTVEQVGITGAISTLYIGLFRHGLFAL